MLSLQPCGLMVEFQSEKKTFLKSHSLSQIHWLERNSWQAKDSTLQCARADFTRNNLLLI